MANKVIFLFAGTTSFVVPSDWNPIANTVETLGGGGSPYYNPTTFGDNFWRGGDGGDYKKYMNVGWTGGSTQTCSIGAAKGYSGSTSKASTPTTISGLPTATTTWLGGAGQYAQEGSHDQVMTGGGAGGQTSAGQAGATGSWTGGSAGGFTTWTSTHNISGGVSVTTAQPGAGGTANGANYGGGAGGYDDGPSGGSFAPGTSAPGIIVLTYTPIVPVTGTLAATEAKDSFAGVGIYGTFGALAATEAVDSFAGSGLLGVTATLAATEAIDTMAATGSVVTGVGGTFTPTEAPDRAALAGRVTETAFSGAGGGIGKGGGVDPWAYHKAIKAARAKRDKVEDLAPPEILDAAEEARKAAAAEKIRLERRARLADEMRQDAAKEEQRRLIAEAKRARQEIEDRQAEAKRLTDALDPKHVEREQRRQRQVHANHDHAQAVHGQALELAGHFLRHLATTPRQK